MTDTTTAVTAPRVLVAGVGNLFLGDDGFGPEVVRRLAADDLPDGVVATDYGIGGIHLAYDLLAGYDTLVLVDVAARGAEPGTVAVIEVSADEDAGQIDAHAMDPATVLASVRRLGGQVPRTLVLACEPADTSEGIGLSPAVDEAVEPTVAALRDLIERELVRIDAAREGRPVEPRPT